MDILDDLLARRQVGRALERAFYTDGAVFGQDMARVWRRGWLFAGHACEIPNKGDYFTYEIDGESLIIIRGQDGQIRALFNSCRHRGSRICKATHGNSSRFICPYHQWTYATDGRLLNATWMAEDFDKSRFSLHQAHCHEVAGLVFICLSETAPDFDAAALDLDRLLNPHGLTPAKIAHTMTYDIAANWKLVIENQRECYHCPAKHKGYAKIQQDTDIDDPDKAEVVAARVAEAKLIWAEMGLDVSLVNATSQFNGDWWRVNRAPFRAGCVSETMDGQPVAPLMGAFTHPDAGNARANVYPSFWLHASSDHCHTMRVTPVDANTTRIKAYWLVAAEAEEGVDYDVESVIAFSKEVNDEDHDIVTTQAQGVQSQRYQPGPFSPIKEANTEHFVNWYVERMRLSEGL